MPTGTTRLAAAALAAALATGVGGCDLGRGTPEGDAAPARPTVSVTPVERPHFTGRQRVSLVSGLTVFGEGGCRDDRAPAWVCDPARDREYLTTRPAHPAHLLEARMDLADGGTSWTVSLRLDPADRPGLRAAREDARASGAMVLVLDGRGDVLLAATVTDAEGAVIRLAGLAKPEAWDTVERVVTAATGDDAPGT